MRISRRHFLLPGLMMLLLVACSTNGTTPATVTEQTTSEEPQRLILATTTSVEDSGLLGYILPDFETRFNAEVDVIAVGTGQALAIGEAGDADAVIVHAPDREFDFLADGHGIQRYDVAYNDFIIIGSPDDPADVRSATSAREAFTRIAEQQATFVSRGDDSGTHIKESDIWQTTGITPEGDWYLSAGQGMGTTLTMTDELAGYTLSDRGTYLARQQEGLALEILLEGDEILFNPYSILLVDPAKNDAINAELAQQFAEWLISVETQQLIADFTVDGQLLFMPNSIAWRATKQAADD